MTPCPHCDEAAVVDEDGCCIHCGLPRTPLYPEIVVPMVGEDGNAFAVLGRVQRALKRAGVPAAELDAFRAEATSGDYDALLATVMRWVDVS